MVDQCIACAGVSGICAGQMMARRVCPCCRPRLNVKAGTLTFTYKMLPAQEAALPELAGTVNTLVANATNASDSMPTIAPATAFYNASLVVDVAGIRAYVDPSLGEKAGLIRFPLSALPAPICMPLWPVCA